MKKTKLITRTTSIIQRLQYCISDLNDLEKAVILADSQQQDIIQSIREARYLVEASFFKAVDIINEVHPKIKE